jgi:hypothetical protein
MLGCFVVVTLRERVRVPAVIPAGSDIVAGA